MPKNESGVVELFKKIHLDLGFEKILNIQSKFPDCIALRNNHEVRIEFEFNSRNFLYHRHKLKKCETIICWIDNLKDYQISKYIYKFHPDGYWKGTFPEIISIKKWIVKSYPPMLTQIPINKSLEVSLLSSHN